MVLKCQEVDVTSVGLLYFIVEPVVNEFFYTKKPVDLAENGYWVVGW